MGGEVDFFDNAKVTDGEGAMEGTRTVYGTNVAIDGDKLTKWIDPQTLRPKRIEFSFVLDEHSITGEILYRPITDGPNVPRMSTIRIIDKDQLVETEFIGYKKQL